MTPSLETTRVPPLQVQVGTFEGPLDLLLHLVRKHRIKIHDLPMALITRQYLEYLEWMKQLHLEIAGEYLVMAATLLYIKSRMLLPRNQDPGGEETPEEDPRTELVNRLLEYQRFREAAAVLRRREEQWREVFTREEIALLPDPTERPLEEVGLFDLLEAFQTVLRRLQNRRCLSVTPDPWTLEEAQAWIRSRLPEGSSISFWHFFPQETPLARLITTFLALLEMIRRGEIRAWQVTEDEIYLERRAPTPPALEA